jgi:hypothetical protein
MRFEDFLKKTSKTPVVLDQKTGDIGTFDITLGTETPAVAIEDKPSKDEIISCEVIPMIDLDNKETYNSLEMYKKIDPVFANSVLNWD